MITCGGNDTAERSDEQLTLKEAEQSVYRALMAVRYGCFAGVRGKQRNALCLKDFLFGPGDYYRLYQILFDNSDEYLPAEAEGLVYTSRITTVWDLVQLYLGVHALRAERNEEE